MSSQTHLAEPIWRINNLYKIIVKGSDKNDGLVLSRSLLHSAVRIFREWHEPTYT